MLNIPPQFESEEWSEGKCSHNKSLILWDNARIWKLFYTFWWCLFYHLIFFPSSFCCAVYLMVSMSRIEQESVVYYYSTWIFGKLRNIIMQSQFGGVSMRKLRERERLPSSFRKYISILIGLKWTENDRPNGRNSTTKRTKWHILSICSRRTF